MAAAAVASPKAPPVGDAELAGRMVLERRYRWLMTWNRAEAPSAGRGEVAELVDDEQAGAAEDRMTVFQRPSRPALRHRVARSAAVVK